MKTLIALLMTGSLGALAQNYDPLCTTVYLVNPFNSCEHPDHGLDLSKDGTFVNIVNEWSEEVKGGHDQSAVCESVRETYNKRHLKDGLHAKLESPLPVEERKRDLARVFRYSYLCSLSVSKYPLLTKQSASCGINTSELSTTAAGEDLKAFALENQLSCLSCDSDEDDVNEYAKCTLQNLSKVLAAGEEALAPEHIETLKKQVDLLEKMNQRRPIKIWDSVRAFKAIAEFKEKFNQ